MGLDFRTADIDLRAKVAAESSAVADFLAKNASESVAISTCNRVEFFVVGEILPETVVAEWIQRSGLSADAREHFSILRDEACLLHLFRVTSSLESMVVGETQITSQVKRAYEEASRTGRIGVYLHRCFQRAFKVAKRIRSQTEVGRLAVSIPSVGVKLAEKVLGSLTETKVGILGLGEIGRVAAEHFSSVQPRQLLLYNRTREVAEHLAQGLRANQSEVAIAETPADLLRHCDIIVNAVDVPLVQASEIDEWRARTRTSLVLDLAVPPQFPLIDEAGHYVYRVDDLRLIADENSRLRSQELEKAERMIVEEMQSAWKSFQSVDLGEILGQVQARADQTASKEIEALKAKLSHLKAEDWVEIEKMARRLSSKVLQDPMVGLRSSLQESEETESLMQFFRSIFRI